MKKVLFATTALVAASFAGAAAAEVKLSGSADFYVTGNDADGYDLANSFDVAFKLSTTTDSGVVISAKADLDETNSGSKCSDKVKTDSNGDTVTVSECTATSSAGDTLAAKANFKMVGDFGTIEYGDTDGAGDKHSIGISTGGIDDEADFYGKDARGDSGAMLRYDAPAMGGVKASVSYGQAKDAFAVGATVDAGAAKIGVGFESYNDDDNNIILSASSDLGGATVKGIYMTGEESGADTDYFGASATFDLGGVDAGVNAFTTDSGNDEGFGAWVEYGLGGGADFVAAISTTDSADTTAGAGITVSF